MMKTLKILFTAPLLVAAIYSIVRLYTGFGFSTTAEILSRISVFFIAAFCVYMIALILKGKPLSTFAAWTMYGITLIAIASVLYMGFGYMQEINGVMCKGFFGTDLNCIESKNLVLHIVILNPFILVPFGLAALIGMQQQIEKGYRTR